MHPPHAHTPCSDYLYVVNTLAAYYPPSNGTGGGTHPRRLLAASTTLDGITMRAGGGSSSALGSRRLKLEEADGQLARHVKQLLSSPTRVMS